MKTIQSLIGMTVLLLSTFLIETSAQTVDTVATGPLLEPYGVAVNPADNTYYITDAADNRIISFSPETGEIGDVTGELFNPQGVVFARGGLVVTDWVSGLGNTYLIRFVSLEGTVTTLAGGPRGNADGPALSAGFNAPSGLAYDAASDAIYIADTLNHRVRKLDALGNVTTLTNRFNRPTAVAVGGGRLYVADTGNHVVQSINLADNAVTVIGRIGVSGSDGGLASSSLFSGPAGLLWVGGDTQLLVADTGNNTIRRVSQKSGVWTVDMVAGLAEVAGSANGSFAAARFSEPVGMTIDRSGIILVADLKNGAIRRLVRRAATTPLLSLPGGTFNNGVSVSLTNDLTKVTANTKFLFTTDGAMPTETSPEFPSPLAVAGGPTTLIVRGFSPDFTASVAVTNEYNFVVADPEISVPGGNFLNNTNVTVQTITRDVTVRYTTDGTEPVETGGTAATLDTAIVSGASVGTLDHGTSGPLLVRVFKTGFTPSNVRSNFFQFTVAGPKVDVAGGSFNNAITVVVANETSADSIFYTLDGTVPTSTESATNIRYTEGADLAISGNAAGKTNVVLSVRGFRAGYADSELLRQTYQFVAAPPTISVPGGTFINNTNVTVNSTTAAAVIRYRTDGVVPASATDGTEWTPAARSFGERGTLMVRAFKADFVPSATVSNVFEFNVSPLRIDVPGGIFNNAIDVVVENDTDNDAIFYTLNGDVPTSTESATNLRYTEGSNLALTGNAPGKASLVLTVRAFKNNYSDSALLRQTYQFVAAAPTLSINGGSFINDTNVTATTTTTGASIRFRTDGIVPATATDGSDWTPATRAHGTSGMLMVRAFKAGFEPSATIGNLFEFVVAPPRIRPAGATYTNDVNVTITSDTSGATFRRTLDGTDPTDATTDVGAGFAITTNNIISIPNDIGGFDVSTNSVLKVIGTKAGYRSSDVSSQTYALTVDTPEIIAPETATGFYANSVEISFATRTTGTQLRYLVGAGELNETTGTAYVSGTTVSVRDTNTVRLAGFKSGYINSAEVSRAFQVKVGNPTLDPPGGFFPSGIIVFANKPAGHPAPETVTIRYTVDGTDPTESSAPYDPATGIDLNQISSTSTDLRSLKVRAFAPNAIPSDVVAGEISPANAIGIPRSVAGGVGASIVLPVVVNLTSNQVVRSMLFNVEVTPSSAAVPAVEDVTALTISPNDFVQVNEPPVVTGSATFHTDSYSRTNGGIVTKGALVSFIGTNANFGVRDFGTVALLRVVLPPASVEGQTYSVVVTNQSADATGLQGLIELNALPARTLTVTNLSYLVGDSSPGVWYNAGDFGDGKLDITDVNNAFYAALPVRAPFSFSDVFNAMDVHPVDSALSAGGDGRVRVLDWQIILFRAAGRDASNWRRSRDSEGFLIANSTVLGAFNSPAEPLTLRPGAVWVREALLTAVPRLANPGDRVSVPVSISIAEGESVAAMVLHAKVLPVGDAPPLTSRASWVSATADGIPAPSSIAEPPLIADNEIGVGWAFGAFPEPLTGRQLLGHIEFTVPATASVGNRYRVRFDTSAGGASDIDTQYDFESRPVLVGIGTQPPVDSDPITDEWREHFFRRINGAIDEARAAMNADPDGDGVPNWKEFLAGTHPADAGSRLHLLAERFDDAGKRKVALRWLSAPGKRYVIESAPDLTSGNWTEVASGVVGDGQIREVLAELREQSLFYRVRLLDQDEP